MYTMDVVTDNGVPLKVALRGADVEFYDTRNVRETWMGQFTGARYDLAVMLHHTGGLPLQGGVADWYVDEAAMHLVVGWLHLVARRPEQVTEGGHRR